MRRPSRQCVLGLGLAGLLVLAGVPGCGKYGSPVRSNYGGARAAAPTAGEACEPDAGEAETEPPAEEEAEAAP